VKEEKAAQLFADRVEDGVREDGKLSDDDAPDVELDPDSDEGAVAGVGEEFDEFDEISDIHSSDVQTDDDEEEEEGDENKEEKGKKARLAAATAAAAAAAGAEEPPKLMDTQDIVRQVLGPEIIKPEEVRRFMLDVGMITPENFKKKFRDRIRDRAQREALSRIMQEQLVQVDKNGTKYYQLRKKQTR
jgi:hypothetical protein